MKIHKIWFSKDRLFIENVDGEVMSQPLYYYPVLSKASENERAKWRASSMGIHFPNLDEDVSFESFTWPDDDGQSLYRRAVD
jgi:hypothetical protein